MYPPDQRSRARRTARATDPILRAQPRHSNAFAVGRRERSAIALTDGLLRQLSPREIAGVLAHEVAHIAHGDLRVMGLADSVSRLTSLFSLTGQILLFVSLPAVLAVDVAIKRPAKQHTPAMDKIVGKRVSFTR